MLFVYKGVNECCYSQVTLPLKKVALRPKAWENCFIYLYATRDSQTKFEGNHMKNGKVTVLKVVEEEQEEEEEEEEEICQH